MSWRTLSSRLPQKEHRNTSEPVISQFELARGIPARFVWMTAMFDMIPYITAAVSGFAGSIFRSSPMP
jgi:hypothetical protein